MKKAFWLAAMLIVFFINVCCAESILIQDIDTQINLNETWVTITRATESIDLSGTPMNYEAFYEAVNKVKGYFGQDEYKNTHAFFFSYDGMSLLEGQVYVEESEGSRETWDIALEPNARSEVKEAVDIYENSMGDLFIGVRPTGIENMEYDDSLVYFTVNNGRAIFVQVLTWYPESESGFIERCHELLEGISFTKKAPKPIDVRETEDQDVPTDNKNDESTWYRIKEFIVSCFETMAKTEISYLTISLIIAVVGGVIAGGGWLISKIVNALRSSKKSDIKNEAYVIGTENRYRLKWHQFLVYFLLWMNALSAIGNAVNLFGGVQRGTETAMYYSFYPQLQSVDWMFGALQIAFAILIVITRFRLARFRSTGPAMLKLCYAIGMVLSLGYNWFGARAVGAVDAGMTALTSTTPSMLAGVFMIIINHIYYRKRSELFRL